MRAQRLSPSPRTLTSTRGGGGGGGPSTDSRQNSRRGCALHLYGRLLLLGLHAALVEALLPLLNLPDVCQRELKIDDVRILPTPVHVRSEDHLNVVMTRRD